MEPEIKEAVDTEEQEEKKQETERHPAEEIEDAARPAPEGETAPEEQKPETFWDKWKKRRALKKEKQKQRTVMQEVWSWVLTLLAAVVLSMLIRMFLGEAIRVDGTSMTNTLQDGEIVLVSKLAYLTGDMERNDIVICRYPGRTNWTVDFGASLGLTQYTIFVKRLVALPGDTVQISAGKLYVNGELVPDPEFMASAPKNFGPIKLEEDQYFVMGDNRYSSHDSRASDVGPISRDAIMGKVVRVLIPWRDVE